MFKNELSNEQLLKRVKSRSAEDVRSPYYRDTTAIIHSSPFRRLKHKTQVFLLQAMTISVLEWNTCCTWRP